MAEFVQQSIEEMVGELHELHTAGLFDGSEIRYVCDLPVNSCHVDGVYHRLYFPSL